MILFKQLKVNALLHRIIKLLLKEIYLFIKKFNWEVGNVRNVIMIDSITEMVSNRCKVINLIFSQVINFHISINQKKTMDAILEQKRKGEAQFRIQIDNFLAGII